MRKKNSIIKELKIMGLVPRKRAYKEMKDYMLVIIIVGIFMLSIIGMWKYPNIPVMYDYHHINSFTPYHTIAEGDELPECGNGIPNHFHWRV